MKDEGCIRSRDYIFKIFSNLWQFFSKCGKVSVSSKAFGFVPFCSILFLLLLVRSVIMTGLPRDCHGSCTDMVEQCTVHIAAGPARAQLEQSVQIKIRLCLCFGVRYVNRPVCIDQAVFVFRLTILESSCFALAMSDHEEAHSLHSPELGGQHFAITNSDDSDESDELIPFS